MSPAERATAAYAAAEATDHPRDKAALRAAAAAWDRIAGPPVSWSTKDLSRDLRLLRIDTAMATGPFTRPAPPKAPSPAAVQYRDHFAEAGTSKHDEALTPVAEVASIQF